MGREVPAPPPKRKSVQGKGEVWLGAGLGARRREFSEECRLAFEGSLLGLQVALRFQMTPDGSRCSRGKNNSD